MYYELMHLYERMAPLVATYGLVADVPGVHTKPYEADELQDLDQLYRYARRARCKRHSRDSLDDLFQKVDDLYDELLINEVRAYRDR